MKFAFDKQWLLRRALLEEAGTDEISAGGIDMDLDRPNQHESDLLPASPALGRLVSLSRRQLGLSLDVLAELTQITEADVLRIEHDESYIPDPATVERLSMALNLPAHRMLQLSGHLRIDDAEFGQQVNRFSARLASSEKLTPEERLALDEFVKFLVKSA